jgi:predicted SprT family Zn-dependent metalloprotease
MYAEIRRAFDLFNAELFGGKLPHCLITLQRGKQTYGYFSSQRFGSLDGRTTDEIALNPEFFAVVPQLEVLQTLAHEMTHLWQYHLGKPGRGRYHNKEWGDKMEAIGLMPSSTGQPGGRRVGDHMADYMIEGGRFARVVEQLLGKEGMRITWFDRFGTRPALYTSTSAAGMAGLPAQAAVVPAEYQECQAIVVNAGLATPGDAGGAAPVNKSLRVKYTCPGCSINVWGKPGLRVLCGDCAEALSPAA